MDGSTQKYKMGTINDSGFYYNYWMPTMASNYGSEAAVRESFAPSAMVDDNGNLYAISLWGFGNTNGSNGPYFAIHKYVDGSLSKRITDFYPWTKIPGVTPQCSEVPKFDHNIIEALSVEAEKEMFKRYIHNAFMPCLAQEIDGGSKWLYGFVYIPTTRLMNIKVTTDDYEYVEEGGTEGMLFFKIKKDGLSELKTTYTPQKVCRYFQYDRLFPRIIKHGNTEGGFQPHSGNFKACYNSGNRTIHLYHSANLDGYLTNSPDFCRSIFDEDGKYQGTSNDKNSTLDEGIFNLVLPPKFVKSGDYLYFMCIKDGYVPMLFMQSITSNEIYLKIKYLWSLIYLDGSAGYGTGGWTFSRYDYDFLVLDAGDKKNKIWCVLCFQGQNKYSGLSETQGWSNTYCNFPCGNASLLLWSFPITNSTVGYTIEDPIQENLDTKFDAIGGKNESSCTYGAYAEYVQNVIYTTECGSTSAVSPDQSGDESKRLYLNTQKICTYKNYIIYAYCYPGKTGKGNHLYIGYAPYVITSNVQLRLLSKTEFKDADGNSFITDCSRIISLDCKNGHVWLTYMAKNDSGVENACYKYFYIKASDLVGE